MRCLVALLFVIALSGAAAASEPLPAVPLRFPPLLMPDVAPENFDLADFRAAERELTGKSEVPKHSLFQIKRHVGASMGWDNGVLHASLGLYLTVAEWGRWNFGVPAPTLGFGRYPAYDRERQRKTKRDEATIIISLASVHYRLGYWPSIGLNSYINIEQVFDARHNMTGSQYGLSFSVK